MQKVVQSLHFELLHAGQAALDDRWNYNNVISPFTRIFLVTKGAAMLHHSHQTFQLRPGYIYLIPSYVYNRYKCESYHEQFYVDFMEAAPTGLSIYNLKKFKFEIPEETIDRSLFEKLVQLYPDRVIYDSEPMAYSTQLANHLKANEQFARMYPDRYLATHGILTLLLSRFIDATATLSEDQNDLHDLRRIQIYIAENLDGPLSISKMAQHFNMSSDHFSRSFTKIIGVRPNRYIQQRRIERAQMLLLTTDDTISEVAEKAGYQSLAYFSRAFKKITGKNPNTFRKDRFDF
ncbi:MAG: helix-turn-helix transcriptional regulator [Pricia sp.]|nr:helix-turn-helix transcriptional regulator [Pricia sp.]